MPWIRGNAGWLGVAVLMAVTVGCSTQGSKPTEQLPSPGAVFGNDITAADHARAARVVPAELWAEGNDRVIASGLRAERLPDGSVRVARDLIPGSDETHVVPLPSRLGEGFLFATRGQNTSLWRAESWTAPLTPLATLEMRAERIEPGFDRIYLLSRRESRAVAADTGLSLPLGPLPAAASYRELSFGSGWTALAEVPIAGVLATFDGGQQWWPVPGARSVVSESESLLVTTDTGLAKLAPDGTLTEERQGGVTEESEEEVWSPRGAPRKDRELLRAMVLHGAYAEQGAQRAPRALVVHEEDLIVLSLDDLRVVGRLSKVVSPGTRCQAIPYDGEAAFVCQLPRGGATQVATVGSRPWRTIFELPGSRTVLASGAAGVVFEGSCRRAPAPMLPDTRTSAARTVCLVSQQKARDFSIPADALAISSASGLLVLEPPHRPADYEAKAAQSAASSKQDERIVGGSFGKASGPRRRMRLPEDQDVLALLTTGQWLAGSQVAKDGRVQVWVVGSERFAGVFIDAQGRVEVGPIQKPARRAMLSGQFGLIWGAAGFAKETVDGGQSWRETSFPYRTGDPDPSQPLDGQTPIQLGCSAVGCSLGPWLRIGWNVEEPSEEAWGEAAIPPTRPPPPAETGRWRLHCQPTGRSSRAFVEEHTVPTGAGRHSGRLRLRAAEGSAAWQPFWEWRAPPLASGIEGYSLGSHLERARLYAWGPREGAWGERGRVQVAFVDPFSIEPVAITPSGRAPFGDARRAANSFGDGGQMGVSHLYSALDPSHTGGLALLRSSTDVELFVFEEGRPPLGVQGASELGLNALEDAVKVGDVWFTLQRVGSSLKLLRVRGSQIAEVSSLQLGRGEAPWVRIVRSVRQHQLGIWVEGAAGRVVYPITLDSGELGAPIRVPPFGGQPRPCADHVDGYLLTTELSPAPQVTVAGTQQPIDVSRVTAQLVVGSSEVCVTQMSASTRDAVRLAVAHRTTESHMPPLIVTEQREGGRRWEMTCR